MRFNSEHPKAITSSLITQINASLLVMKHFIELNEKLVPLYYSLLVKNHKNKEDIQNIEKINKVCSAYEFEETTSEILLHSDIFKRIKLAFQTIENEKHNLEIKKESVNLVLDEINRLKNNWNSIQLN